MTRAEELAEQVRWHIGVLRMNPGDDADDARAALSKLVADAEALAEALAEIDELAPEGEDEAFDCGRHDEPNHDHEFYFQLWDHGFCVGLQRMGDIARAALARHRGEK